MLFHSSEGVEKMGRKSSMGGAWISPSVIRHSDVGVVFHISHLHVHFTFSLPSWVI
jgi:hypothetical protein